MYSALIEARTKQDLEAGGSLGHSGAIGERLAKKQKLTKGMFAGVLEAQDNDSSDDDADDDDDLEDPDLDEIESSVKDDDEN